MVDVTDELPEPQRSQFKALLLAKDVLIERERSKHWQKLAGRYDDIRDWLRTCQDDPNGWQEFYRQACMTIFGEYRDEGSDPDGPAPLMDVGYHIQIPQELALPREVMGAYGPRREEQGVTRKRQNAWIEELSTFAKTVHPKMRVQPQPESIDHVGFPVQWVIVFNPDIEGDDIEEARLKFHDGGYYVSSITSYYSPAMA